MIWVIFSPDSEILPTLFEENAFAKKNYNFKIIILEGFSLFDAKYLLLKIQLIYLMAG